MPLCRPFILAAGIAASLFAASPSWAQPVAPPTAHGVCRQAITAAEKLTEIPQHLLHAIALVESGISVDGSQTRTAWPWTVMARGKGRYFRSRADAVDAVRTLLREGTYNIDVGCMQVNLRYHGLAFRSLEEAFDPVVNVAYAAGFLKDLHGRHGTWDEAVRRYHSATPALHTRYQRKVRAELVALKRTGAPMTAAEHTRLARSRAAPPAAPPPVVAHAPSAPSQPPQAHLLAQAPPGPNQAARASSGYLKLAQWPPQSYKSQQQAEFHARARVFYPPAAAPTPPE